MILLFILPLLFVVILPPLVRAKVHPALPNP